MSKLKLNLQIEGLSDVRSNVGAVANLYDITEKRTKRKNQRNIFLPIGRSKEVIVEPGKYMVEAILPSGQVLNDSIVISQEIHELELKSVKTEHEWLRYQQYAGNLGPTGLDFRYKKHLPKKGAIDVAETYLALIHTEIPLHSYRKLLRHNRLRQLIKPAFSLFPFYDQESFARLEKLVKIHPREKDYKVAELHVISEYMLEDHDIRFDPGYHRLYFLVSGRNIKTQYCVIPFPWTSTTTHRESSIEVLVHYSQTEKRTGDSGYRIVLTPKDPQLNAILGYLSSGQLPTATKIVNQAMDRLFYKFENPIAAAAGCYVLLETEDLTKEAHWYQWVENLMQYFPWLPDGAIQNGWLILNREKTTFENMEYARKNLLEGYLRGIPYYSAGIKMLMDGLTIIDTLQKKREETDKAIHEALEKVKKLAMNVNMRQPFTTLQLDSPAKIRLDR